MGVLKAIFIITTLFDLAFSDDQVLAFEVSLPDVMNTFTSIDQALRTLQDADIQMPGANTLAENLMMKVQWKIFDYMANMLNLQRRENQVRPKVEMGPGAITPELLKYPPHFFASRLKTLIKIKQRQEEANKNLNAT